MISHGKDMKVFSGNANKGLARDVCRLIGIQLGNSEISHFADGEVCASIYESVRGSDVFLIQSTSSPVNDHLMELLVMINALVMDARSDVGAEVNIVSDYKYSQQVNDILAYINQNIGQNITVEQLAGNFFLSESYICRIFKQATGTTINKYITARRISIAKAHLNEGDSVNTAFEKSGFGDYSSFFKAFTKAVGVSPKKYANLSVS